MSARTRRFVSAALLLTLTVATGLCAYWAIRVPFFALPDELAHADYVFALHDAGRPFAVRDAHPERVVTPQERYLARAVRYRETRYTAGGALPAGYGTRAFFERVDRDAPPFAGGVPSDGSAMPYVMFAYPLGYYAVAAAFVRIHEAFSPNSVTGDLFAARFVGVVCLPLMLLLAYGTFLRLRFPPLRALLATIAIGCLPLTSWVFGYVQPDVLTTTLITAALYTTVRWKRAPSQRAWPVATSAALIALAFVKQHYAVATLVAAFLAASSLPRTQRSLRTLAATFFPPAIAIGCALQFEPVGAIGRLHFATQASAAHASMFESIGASASLAVAGLGDAFGGGDAFRDFWSNVGLHGASIFPHGVARAVPMLLLGATLCCVALFVVRQRFVFGKLVRIFRRRSKATALRLLAGDIVVNLYTIVTVILVGVYAASGGTVWLEGRYWLPVIVPMMAIVIGRNGRMLPRRIRSRFANGVALAWAAYAILAAPAGILAVDRAFYHVRSGAPAFEPYAGILDVSAGGPCASASGDPPSIERTCRIVVRGYAIDGETGLPAKRVMISIDGNRSVAATAGLPSPQLAILYNDDELANSGFAATIDPSHLATGRHAIGIAVAEQRGDNGFLAGPQQRAVVIRP